MPCGVLPEAMFCAGSNVPLPLPSATEMRLSSVDETQMSVRPSLSKSAGSLGLDSWPIGSGGVR